MEIILLGARLALIGGLIQITYTHRLARLREREAAIRAEQARTEEQEALEAARLERVRREQIHLASMDDVMRYGQPTLPPPMSEPSPSEAFRARGWSVGRVLVWAGAAGLIIVGLVYALRALL